jgi:hypothetical protein
MEAAEVLRVTITRSELGEPAREALRELIALGKLPPMPDKLPLMPAKVEIELKGVPTAVVNAMRRVATDEMLGHSLMLPVDGLDTELSTEAYMLPEFVGSRIRALVLRPRIPPKVIESLRLRLDVTNTEASPIYVYSGDLVIAEGDMPEPLFNPTTRIAFIYPGKRLVLNGIRIVAGYGRDHGLFLAARLAAYTHLDLPQYTDAEMREEGGPAVDLSGYKVSSLVANPRHHLLTAYVPATPADPSEARAVFVDVCVAIKDRLRLVKTAVDRHGETPSGGFAHRGVQYTVVQLGGGLYEGILRVPNETYTIGELLKRAIFELVPGVANDTYVVAENCLTLTVRHVEDVTQILARAIEHLVATFDAIQSGIASTRRT